MNRFLFVVSLSVLCGTFRLSALDRGSTGRQGENLTLRSRGTVTSVPFNGVRYFIMIAPLPEGNIDHMPMYMPRQDRALARKDSLRLMFPDTVPRHKPRQTEPFIPR